MVKIARTNLAIFILMFYIKEEDNNNMFIDSVYTKVFDSHSLTRQKYNELHDLAVHIREVKNTLSNDISQNLFAYIGINSLAFLKQTRKDYHGLLSSCFDRDAFITVITAYQNKFAAIVKALQFEHIIFKGFTFYKRTTKQHHKGDFKGVSLERKSTPLSICLTYLARYGNDNTVEYIQQQLAKVNGSKQAYYQSILDCIGKYTFHRLYNLAMARRNRVVRQKNKKPIEFRSLSFSARCRKQSIVDFNSNYNSCIKAFVNLSGIGRKSFYIPVKYAKDYHGRMGEYKKATPDYQYTLTFDERRHQVHILLAKDGQRFIPEAHGDVVGIDVNVKHNLFTLSDGTTYDYDRQLVEEFCRVSKEIDKLKAKDKTYIVGKRKQAKLDKLKEKIVKYEQSLIAGICKTLQQQGVGHIVMENLDNGFGKSYVKDEEGLNYNRRVKFLGISSLKGEVEHIGKKYGIAVSTVQAEYTSKMCPICGCIDDENRETQESFSCVECGYESNADLNAALNIRNRVCVAVLRNALLKQLDNGAYEPRKLKREKVREVLLSCRSNLRNKVEKHSSC